MTESRNEAQKHLELAQNAETEESQITHLETLVSLIFVQEPSLLTDFFPLVLEFYSIRKTSIRKWLINTIEMVCKKHPEFVVNTMTAINELLDDENPSIVKRSILCMARLYPHILFLLANATFASPSHHSLWNSVTNIRTKIDDFFLNSKNTPILGCSIKFLEAVVVSHSLPNEKYSEKSIFTINQVPNSHFLLRIDKLRENAETLFGHLSDKLLSSPSDSLTYFLLSSFMVIGKRTTDFLNQVLQIFIKFTHQIYKLPKVRLRSTEKHLKFVFMGVLKVSSPEFTPELSDTLRQLGIQQYDRSKKEIEVKNEPRAPEPPIDIRTLLMKNMPPIAAVTPNLQQLLQGLNAIPLQLVVALVEHGIQTLQFPDELEPLNLPDGEDENTLVHLIATAISPEHRQQQVKKKEEEPVKPVSRSESKSSKQDLNDVIPLLSSDDVRGQKRKEAMTAAYPRKRTAAASREGKPEAKLKRSTSDVVLGLPTLNKKMLGKLASSTFSRIITSEQGVLQGGEGLLRIQILSSLATKRPMNDPNIQELIDNISKDFSARLSLALQWLYDEWTLHTDNGKRYHSVLKKILNAMRAKLKPSDKLFTTFLLKVPHIPKDVYDILHEYCEDTIVMERMALGISTLRELALQRPPCRAPVLRLLLRFTVHQNESLRTAAIRLVSVNLLPHQMFTDHILQWATKLLKSLTTENSAEKNTKGSLSSNPNEKGDEMELEELKDAAKSQLIKNNEEHFDQMELDAQIETSLSDPSQKEFYEDLPITDESLMDMEHSEKKNPDIESQSSKRLEFYDENIKRRLHLYFHLCSKRHELLHGLVEVYCKVDSKVKSLILRQSGPLIRTIGMTSPALLTLLRTFPTESETFILGLLHALTEGQAPTPDLVIVVREVYETRNLNPRFLIPIIPGLTKTELCSYVPKLIELPTKIVQTVISKIVNSKPSPLTPSELLITLHTMDTKTVSLKRIIEAIQLCFEEKALVRQDVLAKALQQLVDMSPIPPLFLRTVIQTTEKCKPMLSYVMSILKSLIVKQIWNDKNLWQGFIKCCKVTLPTSIPILLQLPSSQFEEALQVPAMADSLLLYCKKNKKQIPKQLLSIIQNIDKSDKNEGEKDDN